MHNKADSLLSLHLKKMPRLHLCTLILFTQGTSGATLTGTQQEKPAPEQAAFCRAASRVNSSA